MSKFEFILNNELQNEFSNLNKKIKPLKFDILAGNEIKLKGNLYEELARILLSSISTTHLVTSRDSTSLCRNFLQLLQVPAQFTAYNSEISAMCLSSVEINGSNINCEYEIINSRSIIQPVNFASQTIVGASTLRMMDQNVLMERMLRSLYDFEDQLFCNLLKAQSPLNYTVAVNQQIESVFYEMINRLQSENLQSESFLIHPRLVRRLQEAQGTRVFDIATRTIFGIPLNISPILEEEEIYLLSTNLGQMYMFENIEFSNSEMFGMASYRFLVREHLNLIMTNNFVKVRIM